MVTERSSPRQLPLWLLFAGVGAISVYIILRAVYVSVTHDEAYTFLNYVIKPIKSTFDITYTNNHLLNSLLTRLSVDLGGASQFVIRIPNLIFGIIYFIFAARLTRALSSSAWMPLLGFVGLVMNPFLLDFFGLSRGYGISLGLLMLSLYLQFRSFSELRSIRYEALAIACTALALTANYTMINYFILHALVVVPEAVFKVNRMRREGKRYWIQGLVLVLLFATLLLFTIKAVQILLHLNQLGNFFFGGDEGLWKSSISSLVSMSCMYFAANNWWMYLATAIPGTIILIAGIVISFQTVRKRIYTPHRLFTLFLVYTICGCGGGLWLQHLVFKMPYPLDRTIIYFLPLFGLLAYGVATSVEKKAVVMRLLMVIFFSPIVAAQLMTFNLSRTVLWSADEGMDQVTDHVLKAAKNSGIKDRPVLVVLKYEIFIPLSFYLYCSKTNIVQPMYELESCWPGLADMIIEIPDQPLAFDSTFRIVDEVAGRKIMLRTGAGANEIHTLVQQEDFEHNVADQRKTLPGYNSACGDWISRDQVFSRSLYDSITEPYHPGTMYLMKFRIKPDEIPTSAVAVFSIARDSGNVVWKKWDLAPLIARANEWTEVTVIGYADVPVMPGDRVQTNVVCEQAGKTVIDDYQLIRVVLK